VRDFKIKGIGDVTSGAAWRRHMGRRLHDFLDFIEKAEISSMS
jgi:hypothetical protein